jgi:hypothetical protein
MLKSPECFPTPKKTVESLLFLGMRVEVFKSSRSRKLKSKPGKGPVKAFGPWNPDRDSTET